MSAVKERNRSNDPLSGQGAGLPPQTEGSRIYSHFRAMALGRVKPEYGMEIYRALPHERYGLVTQNAGKEEETHFAFTWLQGQFKDGKIKGFQRGVDAVSSISEFGQVAVVPLVDVSRYGATLLRGAQRSQFGARMKAHFAL